MSRQPPHPPHAPHPPDALARLLHPTALDGALARLVPDPAARAFVSRCIVGEGPIHHRGASFVLIEALHRLLERLPPLPSPPSTAPSRPFPMRLPPHVAPRDPPPAWPLTVPLDTVEALGGSDPVLKESLIDCVTDGPPHHALANVVMLALIEAALERLPDGA